MALVIERAFSPPPHSGKGERWIGDSLARGASLHSWTVVRVEVS